VEVGVVVDDQHPVHGAPNVQFDRLSVHFPSSTKRGDRVLSLRTARATVSDDRHFRHL
jgi:hypothetical protein